MLITLSLVAYHFKKKMENGFLCPLIGKFPGATEHLKKWSCFSGRNVPNGDSCYDCDLSLIPVTGKWNWFAQIVNTILEWTLLTREPTGFPIPYFRSEKKKKFKKTGTEMRPAIVSGIVIGDAPVSYWPIFFPVPGNSPRSLYES